MSTFDLITRIRADGAQATTEFNKVGEGLKKLGIVVGVAFGATQLVKFGQELFQVGIESEAFGRRYQTVFGENTATLDAWVDANHEAFGVAADEVQGMLASVAQLLTPLGVAGDEAGTMASKILEMGNAWSVASGGQITAMGAVDKLTRGMMGQTRGLMELNMKISEEEVAARLAAAGLEDLTGVEATRAKTMVMFQLIQERSVDTMGAYSEAMTGAVGDQRELQTVLDEAKDSMGEFVVSLSPVLSLMAQIGSVPVLGDSLMGLMVGAKIAGPVGAAAGAIIAFGLAMDRIDPIDERISNSTEAIDLFRTAVTTATDEELPGLKVQLANMGWDDMAAAVDDARGAMGDMQGTVQGLVSWIDILNTALFGVPETVTTDFSLNIDPDTMVAIRLLMVDPMTGVSSLSGLGLNFQGPQTQAPVGITPLSEFELGGGRAAGGPVFPRQAYMVGEVGPELFVPSTAGQIIPASAGGRGGGDVYMTVQVAGSLLTTQELAGLLEQELVRAARRGATSEIY